MEEGAAAAWWAEQQGLADLLIARRDIPLRASDWPAIRARIRRGPRAGTPATTRAPAPRERRISDLPDWDWKQLQLSVVEHAETLVLTGTSRALFDAGDELTWCGNEVAVNSDIRRFGGPALLSQFNGPQPRPGRRDNSWECMVLAEDRPFCRRP
ncbi:hypothetical protein [Plantactinospora sp. GCM10030261]|uniref:hypothetical protein n=1 Tax=Plantactinospora sp. GCM10030261 TaxID=3273420 RepID=UPI00360D4782